MLAVVGTMSGCEMYRVLNPLSHLRALGFQCGWVMNTDVKRVNIDDWDVIVLARLGLLDLREREGFFAELRSLGKTIVYEIDDDLAHIPDWNPSRLSPDQVEGIVDMIRRSDLVTVSTRHLARRMREYNPNVAVLPNCIDPDLWAFSKAKVRAVEGLTVGVQGGNSHLKDWEILAEVFPVLAERYPAVKFVVAGYHPPYFDELGLGDRLVKLGWVPIQHYPALVAQLDVNCCPLQDDEFSRSKSPIKWMEAAALGIPSVCSPTVYGQVVTPGQTGFLARDKQEWIRYLGRLIERPRLRREIGAAARGHVLRRLNIHEMATLWMQVYRSAWQRTRA